MADKVRLAFVGLGHFSDVLADAATKSKRIEIAACCSRTEAKMAAFTAKFGGVAKKTYGEVLKDDRINAVVLTTPNSLHAPQTIEAAKNGKHVFVEKPMALSVADCKQMILAAKEAGVVLAVGHKERKLARTRKAKELIDKGAIGQIVLAEANHSDSGGLTVKPDNWKWYRKEMPAGPVGPLTIHHADNLNYLVGSVKRVTGFMSKVCTKAEPDDVIAAVVEFQNKALGYIGGTWVTPIRKYVQIHGTDGVILVDQEGGAVYYQPKSVTKGIGTLVRQECLPEGYREQRTDAVAEEMEEFATCILEKKKPETAGEEGLAAWAIIEAMIKSAETGLPIEIKQLL